MIWKGTVQRIKEKKNLTISAWNFGSKQQSMTLTGKWLSPDKVSMKLGIWRKPMQGSGDLKKVCSEMSVDIFRCELPMAQRHWREGCWIRFTHSVRKRTMKFLEILKLLLAFSSKRVDEETILSVASGRTVKCISCTMEHSKLNCWLILISATRGSFSFHPELWDLRSAVPKERKRACLLVLIYA